MANWFVERIQTLESRISTLEAENEDYKRRATVAEAKYEARRSQVSTLEAENKELAVLREAVRQLWGIRDLGDFIYTVRDGEGLGWEGPQVKAWGESCAVISKALTPAEKSE